MKALLCTAYGSPPTLQLGHIAERSLLPGEVRIAVAAVGLGYFDSVLLSGKYQERPELPLVPGREHAGEVVEIGAGVDPSFIGRTVAALAFSGACCERSVARAAHCLLLPNGTAATTGAAMLSSYATMLYAFQDCGKLRPGERVLILGAAGTVGIAAIDLARALGGRPIAVASTAKKRRFCFDHGAEIAIDGSDPAWRGTLADAVGKVDVVVDSVGGAASEIAFRCLAPGGRHLVIGFSSGEIARLPLNLCLLKRASAVGVDWGGFMQDEAEGSRALLDRLAALLASGRIHPAATSISPLGKFGAVLGDLAARRSVGKPVIHTFWE